MTTSPWNNSGSNKETAHHFQTFPPGIITMPPLQIIGVLDPQAPLCPGVIRHEPIIGENLLQEQGNINQHPREQSLARYIQHAKLVQQQQLHCAQQQQHTVDVDLYVDRVNGDFQQQNQPQQQHQQIGEPVLPPPSRTTTETAPVITTKDIKEVAKFIKTFRDSLQLKESCLDGKLNDFNKYRYLNDEYSPTFNAEKGKLQAEVYHLNIEKQKLHEFERSLDIIRKFEQHQKQKKVSVQPTQQQRENSQQKQLQQQPFLTPPATPSSDSSTAGDYLDNIDQHIEKCLLELENRSIVPNLWENISEETPKKSEEDFSTIFKDTSIVIPDKASIVILEEAPETKSISESPNSVVEASPFRVITLESTENCVKSSTLITNEISGNHQELAVDIPNKDVAPTDNLQRNSAYSTTVCMLRTKRTSTAIVQDYTTKALTKPASPTEKSVNTNSKTNPFVQDKNFVKDKRRTSAVDTDSTVPKAKRTAFATDMLYSTSEKAMRAATKNRTEANVPEAKITARGIVAESSVPKAKRTISATDIISSIFKKPVIKDRNSAYSDIPEGKKTSDSRSSKAERRRTSDSSNEKQTLNAKSSFKLPPIQQYDFTNRKVTQMKLKRTKDIEKEKLKRRKENAKLNLTKSKPVSCNPLEEMQFFKLGEKHQPDRKCEHKKTVIKPNRKLVEQNALKRKTWMKSATETKKKKQVEGDSKNSQEEEAEEFKGNFMSLFHEFYNNNT